MTNSATLIRPAVLDDSAALMRLAGAYFEEAGFDYPADATSIARSLALLAEAGTILVVDHRGAVVGMAAVAIHASFWNFNILLARQCLWYVDPAHRKGAGRALLDALEALVAARGAVMIHAVAEDGARSIGLSRLYRAGGFAPAETIFRKRLSNDHGVAP